MLNKFYFLLYIAFVIVLSGCRRDVYNNTTGSGLPPAVPVGLRVVSAYDGAVLIGWHNNTEPDFTGYNVYRSIDGSSFTFLNFTTNDYYFDDSLNYNLNYYYKINAINNAGLESLLSDSVSAHPINLYPPDAPANISFTISARNWEGQKSVVLNWNANIEGDVAWYNVYRSTIDNFTADTTVYIGRTHTPGYTDTTNLVLYTNYYYKLKAVDKGNLQSSESHSIHDMIFDIPAVIFPPNKTQSTYFNQFTIKTLSVPADYKIVLQTNQFFDEFWSTVVSSSILNDTLNIAFTPPYLTPNATYYWRVSTYSQNSGDPNSISQLYQFTIKP